MPPTKVLLTDDISSLSVKGRKRSHQLRNLAAHLCQALEAQLHFLYVEDIPEHLRKRKLLAPLDKRSPQMITQLKEDLDKVSPESEVHIESGHPLEGILKWIKKNSPNLVVIGTRGLSGIGKIFLGSVAEEVIRHSTVPVVVVGPKVKKAGFATKGKKQRILLLTDLTSASKPAEDFARKLAKSTDARVTIFHSVGDAIMHVKEVFLHSRIPIYSLDKQIAEMKRWGREETTKRVDQFKKDGIVTTGQVVTEEREIEKELKRELESDYDLLIMGTHSRNKLLTSFLGSTARNACLTSPVPVVVVRSI
ncbi:universal stress protein [Bdellovibrio svalbardensis]|uniref:Universal stress protein n=1 Tax=Bdellovibrio svalbardensis TaxID=2972972 RepID=A0ABT6DND8_9BACT|nr:universal stress protein [Bdellovibrio svalbardensis]MDG0818139.1 universal stress protein [Bdellovibrio svalbardensis]